MSFLRFGRWAHTGLTSFILLGSVFSGQCLGAKPVIDERDCSQRPFKVVVDIGHSPRAFGATSARGRREYDFNKRFSNELVERAGRYEKLSASLLSSDRAELSLRDRVQLANSSGADLFLSIHHDSAQVHLLRHWTYKGRKLLISDTIRGFSMFISRENPEFSNSLATAQAIASAWRSSGHSPTLHHAAKIKGENRELLDRSLGIYEAPFAVVRRTRIPAILLEVGVLINPKEEEWLDQLKNRNQLQDLTWRAVLAKYCSG